MIALADSDFFRQGIMLLCKGVPYECIFGQKKQWSRNMRNAATMVINELSSPEDDTTPGE